jgi:hypothetical protein
MLASRFYITQPNLEKTMTTLQQAAEQALEALETSLYPQQKQLQAITAIREALAQPEQEPVAYLCENAVGHKYFRWKKPSSTYKPIALYTTPPAAPVQEKNT